MLAEALASVCGACEAANTRVLALPPAQRPEWPTWRAEVWDAGEAVARSTDCRYRYLTALYAVRDDPWAALTLRERTGPFGAWGPIVGALALALMERAGPFNSWVHIVGPPWSHTP